MTEQEMTDYVAEYGGEFNYKTVKGEIQDIHYLRPESLEIAQRINRLRSKQRHSIK